MPEPVASPSTYGERVVFGAVREQLGLHRYGEGVVRDVLAVLEDARGDLERQLRLAIERRRVNTPTVARLRAIRQELRQVIAEAYQALGEELESGLVPLARRAAGSHARRIETSLPFAFDLDRPDPVLLEAIARRDPFAGRLLSEHVSTLESAMRQELLREVQVGMTLGETTGQITRRVMGTEAAGFADGALALSRHQATALTRTAVQHVHAEARDRLYRDNREVIRGVMGVVTLDERTCRFCGPRDGKVWLFPDYRPSGHSLTWGAGAGRWHYQCRCTSIPLLSDVELLASAGVDLDVLSSGQRAALGGPVDVGTDYEDWLRVASLDVREQALGKRRAAWWDDHPDVSLSQAWARRFGGTPVERATLDEALGA